MVFWVLVGVFYAMGWLLVVFARFVILLVALTCVLFASIIAAVILLLTRNRRYP
jgi:hypothetical protein